MSNRAARDNCGSEPAGGAAESVASRLASAVPETLWRFLTETCEIPAATLRTVPGPAVPEPARRLLVHRRDMTSTLAEFHGSALRADVLQSCERDGLYLREVFLRAVNDDAVVEYGVIAIALEQFSPAQREVIRAGKTPLGAVLHQFQIGFESSPLAFFSIAPTSLEHARFAAFRGAVCFGRFNRLSTPAGAPLAWIMEILPPASPAF